MPRVDLETAMKIIKIGTTPMASWPLQPDASRATVLRRDIYWWGIMTHSMMVIFIILYDIHGALGNDIEHVITVSAEMASLIMAMTSMVISKVEEPRLQALIGELQSFMKHANQEELDMIQFYVDKTLLIHGAILVSTIIGPSVFLFSPAVTKEILPLDSQYPYHVEVSSFWVWIATYFSQSVSTILVGCTAVQDFMYWILLWYTGARIDLLGTKLGQAKTPEDVKRCVRLHHYLLEYLARLKVTARLLAFQVTVIATLLITTGGFVLMRGSSMLLIVKFIMFDLVAVLRLFLYTWPCDHIMSMGDKIVAAAFDCDWIGKSPAMMKDLIFIMHKAQSPMIVDVPGVVPAMNLEFYSGVLKAAFSYLTTLYAMFGN